MSKTTNNKNKTATATNALAKSSSTTDSINILQQELKKLKTISETPYNSKDKRILRMQTSEGVNIQTETSIRTLLSLRASIVNQERVYNESGDSAVKEGLITSYPVFEIEGVSAEGLLKDIQLRLQVLSTEERRTVLDEILKGYTEILDKDDRRQILDMRLQDMLRN